MSWDRRKFYRGIINFRKFQVSAPSLLTKFCPTRILEGSMGVWKWLSKSRALIGRACLGRVESPLSEKKTPEKVAKRENVKMPREKLFNFCVVLDFEATCYGPREKSPSKWNPEIVEFPAVLGKGWLLWIKFISKELFMRDKN